MVRVAIIGEGKNDFGGPDGFQGWKDGAAQPFIRKFLEEANIAPLTKQMKSAKGFATPGRNPPKFGIHTSALRSFFPLLDARKDEIDLLIFYQDLDKQESGKADEQEARRSYRKVMSEIDEAFAYIKHRFQIQAIAMIPMRMLENWLLADENAFEIAFGSKPTKPRLPNQPEFIWGDEQDRDSEHPKNYIRQVLEQYGQDKTTDNFILIAEASDIATMRKTCPHSFASFADRMKNFVEQRV